MTSVLYYLLLLFLGVTSLGGLVYYLLAIFSIRRLRRLQPDTAVDVTIPLPPISLLKPLNGADPGLELYLRTFFAQDYPQFEILLAVRHESDPAVPIVRNLMAEFSQIPARLILTGEPPFANAKVYSMELMAQAARFDILVITDSDASVRKDYLRQMAKTFYPAEVGAMTNLYRGVGELDFWSKLEALGMSTEFMAGVVVAERLEGMKFALGPSMAIRRECLEKIGGFARMAEYLADDFVLGNWADGAGYTVALSTHVINHHASTTGFTRTFVHRLRWNRSSRFSRPDGYVGQGFTYGLVWAIGLAVIAPFPWNLMVLGSILLIRFWLAIELGTFLLQDRSVLGRLWMIPLQDVISWATWLGAFFGREIVWRQERYRLEFGGRFVPVVPRSK